MFYIEGRDNGHRPVIVFNCIRLVKLKIQKERIIDYAQFVFDFAISNYMVPGKIETWVFICDLDGIGVTNAPANDISAFLGNIGKNFRSRLHQFYGVNSSWTLKVLWGVIKGILDKGASAKMDTLDQKKMKAVLPS